MKILAIETSCERASIALRLDGAVVAVTLEGRQSRHSERLLPTLKRLLEDAGIALSQLDAVAFGAGPGAFTGLRLACSVAQGLAMGAGLGVVAVGSLDALARQGRGENVLVVTDARMGEIYSSTYRLREGLPERVSDLVCCPPDRLTLPETGQWFALGSALQAYPELLHGAPSARWLGTDAGAVPHASDVAWLAEGEVSAGRGQTPEAVAPLYVRDKVALTTAERLARGGRA